jgi:hypothetical protein
MRTNSWSVQSCAPKPTATMVLRVIPVLLLALAAPSAIAADPGEPGIVLDQFSFHQRIIIRIPVMPVPPVPPAPMPDAPPPRWVEHGAPKCLSLDHLTGAAVTGTASVDFMMDDGQRMRAVLDADCPALDFYSGFYLTRNDDGKVCAERDRIHSRAGAACPIQKFRKLVAHR